MRPSEILQRHRLDVLRILASYPVAHPRVIGSVARGDDTEQSDIDILVDREAGFTLLQQANLAEALADLLKVRVDIVTSKGPSALFLARVLQDAKPI